MAEQEQQAQTPDTNQAAQLPQLDLSKSVPLDGGQDSLPQLDLSKSVPLQGQYSSGQEAHTGDYQIRKGGPVINVITAGQKPGTITHHNPIMPLPGEDFNDTMKRAIDAAKSVTPEQIKEDEDESLKEAPGTLASAVALGATGPVVYGGAKGVSILKQAIVGGDSQILGHPENLMTPESRKAHPYWAGALETAGGLSSPENAAMMIGTGALSKLPGTASKVASRLVSSGFGITMLSSAVRNVPELWDVMQGTGKYSDMSVDDRESLAKNIVFHSTVDAAMGAQALEHGVMGESHALTGFGEKADTATALAAQKTVNAVKSAPSAAINLIGSALGRTNDFDTAIKRSSKIPTKQVSGHMDKIANVREDLQAILNESKDVIEDPKTFGKEIDKHIQEHEAKLQKEAGATKGSDEPVVSGLMGRLTDRLDTFFDDHKGLYGDESQVAEAKKKILEGILQSRNGQHLLEPNLFEAENVRRRLNRDAKPQYATNATPTTDAYKAGAGEAAHELRQAIDESYESKGVQNVKEFRQKESNLIDVRDRLYDAQDKAEKMGEGTVFQSLIKKIGVPSSVIAIALGHPISGAAIGAAVLGDQIVQNVSNPNVNVSRAIDIAGRNPNSRMTEPAYNQSRVNSPIHGALASHYGELVGQSTYPELQGRFMAEIAAKAQRGTPLQPAEKTLLTKLNDTNIQDSEKAKAEAEKQAQVQAEALGQNAPVNGVVQPAVKPTLPLDAEHVMDTPNMPNGMSVQQGIAHDIAHAVVANETGVNTVDGIRSHLHPENAEAGSLMSTPLDWSDLTDKEGNLDFNKMKSKIDDIATTYVAGGVANDLWHGISFTENHGLGADLSILRKFMKFVKMSDVEASRVISRAADRARDILSRPGVRETIEGHADVREPDLDEKYHLSQERLQQVLQDVKEGSNEGSARNSSKSARNGNAANEGDAARGKEGSPREPENGVVKPVGEGLEGKGEPTSKGKRKAKNPKLSTTTEPEIELIDQEEEAGQGGHAGGGVSSVEELNRPGRFVKVSRSGEVTDQNKVPDFLSLRAGEAGYQVKPDGSYELKAGQESPATKRGVEGYAREKYGSRPQNPKLSTFEQVKPSKIKEGGKDFEEQKYPKSYEVKVSFPNGDSHLDEVKGLNQGHALSRAKGNWPDASNIEVTRETTRPENPKLGSAVAEPPAKEETERLPKVKNLSVPHERTTGRYDADIKQGGGIPGGIQKGDQELDIPDYAIFHDPSTGSSLMLPVDKVTPENVKNQLTKSRKAYLDAEDRAERVKNDVAFAADEFNQRSGRPVIDTNTKAHNPEFAKRVADAYDQMQHNPNDPKVKASYTAMKSDVDKQYDYAINKMGMHFEPWTREGQPYANSKEMVKDVKDNHHLYFFQGGESPADNPMQEVDPKTGLTYNDKFRAVHDLFGHAAQGNQFGPKGEEVAYQLHRQMFSPEAIPALTSETRGQNSWVNYGKHLRDTAGNVPEKGQPGFVPQTERPYAEQKSALLPEQFHRAEPAVKPENPKLSTAVAEPQATSEKLVDKYGTTDNPHDAGFILNDGRMIPLRNEHDSMLKAVHSDQLDDQGYHGPLRANFINDENAVRTRFRTGKGGREIVFSVPKNGVSPEQLEQIKRSVGQLRNGNVVMEVGENRGKSTTKEFARVSDVEPMLREIGAMPEAVTAENPKLSTIKDDEHPWVAKAKKLFGETRPGQPSPFIFPDGTGLQDLDGEHRNLISAMPKLAFDQNPEAAIENYINETKGMRTGPMEEAGQFFQGPTSGFSDPQIAVIRKALRKGAAPIGIEVRTPDGEYISKTFDFPLASEINKFIAETNEKLSPIKPENPKLAARTQVRPKGSTVELMDNPLDVKASGESDKPSTIDVAMALNKFTKKQLPALQLGKAEPAEMVARAKSLAEDEAKYQLAQNNSGEAWYTKDIAEHDKTLQAMRPELENPAKMSLFKMVEAVLSSGQKPYANFKSAVKAWDYYNDTGKFPEYNPETKMSWGPRGIKAYGSAIDSINRLIKEKGEQGASDWLLSEHPIKELHSYMTPTQDRVSGKADDLQPGVMILGPKRGPFAQNLHGRESAFTADMWVSRTWNRWMGTTEVDPTGGKNGEGEISTDSPRSSKERKLMQQSFQETAQKLKLSTSALQAVLWYYEQALYDAHGSSKESWNFADAAKRASDEEFSQFKFGEPEEEHAGVSALAGKE